MSKHPFKLDTQKEKAKPPGFLLSLARNFIMKEYHKIQSIYKRDEKTHKFIEGQFSLDEFEYLAYNSWVFTEKIDGTNIRIDWDCQKVTFGGRTANAQTPTFLITKLQDLFPAEKFYNIYPDTPMTLYGEGYGAKIQKGGENYIANGVSFILFDVLINNYWLKRIDTIDIAEKLEIDIVPIVGNGTLYDAINLVKQGFNSTFSNFIAEGLVLRPEIELFNRMGHRIITKVKHKDF